jgi:O-antigen/teichoic acid export membrane protein
MINLGSALVKLLSSVVLILVGLGVSGAFYGITISAFIAWFFGFIYINKKLRNFKIDNFIKDERSEKKRQNLIPTIFSCLLISLITNLDVPAVNAFFSTNDAGIYSAASVLGKVILFVPMSIIVMLYPITVKLNKQRSEINLVKPALLITLLFSLLLGIIYVFFADKLIYLAYGEKYEFASGILRYYGIALIPITLVIVCENYLLAQGKLLFTWIILIVVPIQFLFISKHNDELIHVVWSVFISGFVVLFIGAIYWFYREKFLKKGV